MFYFELSAVGFGSFSATVSVVQFRNIFCHFSISLFLGSEDESDQGFS